MNLFVLILLEVFLIFLFIVIAVFAMYLSDSLNILLSNGSKKHVPDYPGITEKTLFGKKDIFCPKCKCLNCTYIYVYETKNTITACYSHNKKIESESFKSVTEKIIENIRDLCSVEKYKCDKCGYISK